MSGKKAILIVDDEAILRMSLRQELRLKFGTGILYETAMNGEAGLAMIGKLRTEGISVVLVISDWLMPGMRGDEFLKEVHARYPEIRLIMLSGHAEANIMDGLFREPDRYAFINKPYRSNVLYDLVSKALAG